MKARRVDGRRGFTVLEVLVYSALSMVLLGGVTAYVNNGLRIYRGGNTYQTAQKDAMLTLRRLSNELTNSTFAQSAGGNRIDLGTSPTPYIIFPSADDLETATDYKTWQYDQTDGELKWRKWVQLSLDTARRALVRTEMSFSPSNKEDIGVPPAFGSFPGTDNIYGRNVVALTHQWQEVGRVLEVGLTTEVPTETGAKQGSRVVVRTNLRVEN